MDDNSLIAYSLPGTKEFLVGTIKDCFTKRPSDLADIDFVMAPFDKSIDTTYWFRFSSISGGRVFSSPHNFSEIEGSSTSREAYNKAFKEIQDSFDNQRTAKVVLSRRIIVPRQEQDLYTMFVKLKNRYPDAFTYLVSTPETGTWMGASPELVLSNQSGRITTTAIAGTQALGNSTVSNLSWGQKEIQEHRYIEDFLKEVLSKNKIDFTISEKSTIQAGDLCHIHSRIDIDSEVSLPALVDLIHPGPALSGYPVPDALSLLDKVESTSREFYCGYLGPVNNNNIDWFANIRCMQVHNEHFTLYVGGGLTSDSNLDAEWDETNMKSRTLLDVLEPATAL